MPCEVFWRILTPQSILSLCEVGGFCRELSRSKELAFILSVGCTFCTVGVEGHARYRWDYSLSKTLGEWKASSHWWTVNAEKWSLWKKQKYLISCSPFQHLDFKETQDYKTDATRSFRSDCPLALMFRAKWYWPARVWGDIPGPNHSQKHFLWDQHQPHFHFFLLSNLPNDSCAGFGEVTHGKRTIGEVLLSYSGLSEINTSLNHGSYLAN